MNVFRQLMQLFFNVKKDGRSVLVPIQWLYYIDLLLCLFCFQPRSIDYHLSGNRLDHKITRAIYIRRRWAKWSHSSQSTGFSHLCGNAYSSSRSSLRLFSSAFHRFGCGVRSLLLLFSSDLWFFGCYERCEWSFSSDRIPGAGNRSICSSKCLIVARIFICLLRRRWWSIDTLATDAIQQYKRRNNHSTASLLSWN